MQTAYPTAEAAGQADCSVSGTMAGSDSAGGDLARFFLIAATPVETLGCLTRGILALVVALASGLAAVGTAIMSARGRSRGDVYAPWWVISTL